VTAPHEQDRSSAQSARTDRRRMRVAARVWYGYDVVSVSVAACAMSSPVPLKWCWPSVLRAGAAILTAGPPPPGLGLSQTSP
jgi:hypothetical protein